MNVVADASHWLESRLRHARRRIVVVSPWLSEEPVELLLREAPPNVQVRVVFRWPCQRSDCWVLSGAGLERLLERAHRAPEPERWSVEYCAATSAQHPLHAKVYVVDDDSLVTSANFTGAGLGLGPGRRNIELGVALSGQATREVEDWLEELDAIPLKGDNVPRLLALLAQPRPDAWADPVEQPALASAGRGAFAAEVVKRCLPSLVPLPRGHGRSTWNGNLFRENAVLKAHVSGGKDGAAFHFEVSRLGHERLLAGVVHGLLLLPAEVDEVGRYRTPDGAPDVVLVSKTALYAERGLGLGALAGHKNLSMVLEQVDRSWQLRIPNAGGRRGRSAVARLVRDREFGGLVLRLTRTSWGRG